MKSLLMLALGLVSVSAQAAQYTYDCAARDTLNQGFGLTTTYQGIPTGDAKMTVQIKNSTVTDSVSVRQFFDETMQFNGLTKFMNANGVTNGEVEIEKDTFLGGLLSSAPNDEQVQVGTVRLINLDTNTSIFFDCIRPIQ